MPRGTPIENRVSIMLKVQPEIAKALDDRRRELEDIPSRPELIRRILVKEFGLE